MENQTLNLPQNMSTEACSRHVNSFNDALREKLCFTELSTRIY